MTTGYAFSPTGAIADHFVNVSTPCTAALNAGCSNFTQSIADMLNRPVQVNTPASGYTNYQYNVQDVLTTLGPASSGENTKAVQKEYNGLGWISSSCAISSTVSGKVSCGQKNGSYSGILDTYVYNFTTGYSQVQVTRGSQTRTKIADGMGRVTTSITPEGGTVSNYYDSYTGTICGVTNPSYPGKLLYTVFGNGNNLCYTYDSNGRLTATGASYSGGSTTLCRRFAYDNSTGALSGGIPSGITISNSMGRMVEAETDNCSAYPVTSPITDEWFSYDKDGNNTDIWEKTPNSTQYYHSTSDLFRPGFAHGGFSQPKLLHDDLWARRRRPTKFLEECVNHGRSDFRRDLQRG